MGCDRVLGLFAALLFVACVMLTSDYAGMNDPQLLGQAVSLWGLVVALRQPPCARAMVVSALLCVLAIFVKHNLVLLPLSLAAWLLLADRRRAGTFIASGAIFALIGLGLFRTAFGTTLFHQISSQRLYSAGNAVVAIANWLPWAAVPLCGAVLLFAIGRRGHRRQRSVRCRHCARTVRRAAAQSAGVRNVERLAGIYLCHTARVDVAHR
jgi:hypothetical protein